VPASILLALKPGGPKPDGSDDVQSIYSFRAYRASASALASAHGCTLSPDHLVVVTHRRL
jgi:hypothetical protein